MFKKIPFPAIPKEIILIFLGVALFLLATSFWLIQKELTTSLENQLEKQLQLFSLLTDEKFGSELNRVQEIAEYIGKNKNNFDAISQNIKDNEQIFQKNGVQQGILTLDFKSLSGKSFTPEQFKKMELLRTGQSIVDFNSNEGLMFAAPVSINGHVVYIFYTLYKTDILPEKFIPENYFSYIADNHIVTETQAGEKIFFYPDYDADDNKNFLDSKILKERLENQNSAVIFSRNSGNIFLLGTKLPKTDFLILGYISRSDVASEMFMLSYILSLIFIFFAATIFVLFISTEKIRSFIRENKAKAAFLENVSHDMQTPLTAILKFTEIILREGKDKILLNHSQKIYNAGSLLSTLTNDLTDLAKIESEGMEVVEQKYNVEDLLKNLFDMTAPHAEMKNLKLNFSADENLPAELFGDSSKIQRIVFNFLSNAVKYTEKGSVELEVKLLGQKRGMRNYIDVRFIVRDTGIGIKDEDKPQLFKKFKRFDKEKNRYVEGMGAGLAITKTFTQLLRGRIDFESVYNQGSTFTVTIPQKISTDKLIGKIEIKSDTDAENLTTDAENKND